MQKLQRKTVLSGEIVFAFVSLLSGLMGSSEIGWMNLLELIHADIDHGFWSMGLAAGSTMIACWSLLYLLYRSPLICNSSNRIQFASSTVIFIGYFIVAERRLFDAPFWDDFNALLEWYVPIKKGEKTLTGSLFSAYWECKTTVPRIISISLERFTGAYFLHFQKYFNGVLLILLAYLFSRNFQKNDTRLTVFTGSMVLLFNFQHFHTTLCAFSGTTYYLTAILALSSFMAMKSSHPKGLTIALTTATLAAWTFGNGWLVFPIVLLETILSRRWRSAAATAVMMTANALPYFIGYHPERLNSIDAFSISGIMEYSVIFLGNSFQFLYAPVLPTIVSILIVLTFVFQSFRLVKSRNTPTAFHYMTLFLIGSAVMAAILRHQSGTHQAFSVRYGFFSLLAFWCMVISLIDGNKEDIRPGLRTSVIGLVAILTLLKAVFFYPEMAIAQEEYREMLRDWKRTGMEFEKNTPFYQRGIGHIMKESERTGIWRVSEKDTLPPNNSMFTIRYIDQDNRWREQ